MALRFAGCWWWRNDHVQLVFVNLSFLFFFVFAFYKRVIRTISSSLDFQLYIIRIRISHIIHESHRTLEREQETDENTWQSLVELFMYRMMDLYRRSFLFCSDIFIDRTETHEAQRLSPVCHVVKHHVTPSTRNKKSKAFSFGMLEWKCWHSLNGQRTSRLLDTYFLFELFS